MNLFRTQIVWQADAQQDVIIRQELYRKIEMHQNLKNRERGMFGKVDDRVAGVIPAPAIDGSAFA